MKIVIIAGPTAAGKTGTAMRAALTLGNAEIISADAFQVYKGLDVGTAKVSKEERAQIPHHLIDIMEPSSLYTAGLFSEAAERIIDEIAERGNIPLVVGGTGLYIKTLTEGIFDCPPIDPEIRVILKERAEREGLYGLYGELSEIDPEYAAAISRNDPVRIVRALEVWKGLGVSFTEAHKRYHKPPKHEFLLFVTEPERSVLYGGINRRTEAMWKNGWPEEVDDLLKKGISKDCPAFRAIGYRAIADYITDGGNERAVLDSIAQDTRRFAKRQTTWFKGMAGAVFYKDPDIMLKEVLNACSPGGKSL